MLRSGLKGSYRACKRMTEVGLRVNGQYSEEFGVWVGVHQGLVRSPLLFILVLETLSLEFCTTVR